MSAKYEESRKRLHKYRRENGLCIVCGQIRPTLRGTEPPPTSGSRKAWLQSQSNLRREIAALHPDLNGGCSPDENRLRAAIVKLAKKQDSKKKTIRVAVGFRVFARKSWWEVIAQKPATFYECRKFLPCRGREGQERRAIIKLSEMTDSRCGPSFRWRMVSAVEAGNWGIPWDE